MGDLFVMKKTPYNGSSDDRAAVRMIFDERHGWSPDQGCERRRLVVPQKGHATPSFLEKTMAQKKTSDKKSSAEPVKKSAAKTRSRKIAAPAPEATPIPISDEEIALRAYMLWENRGKPLGSPDEDWHRAAEELRQATAMRAGSITT